MNKTGFIFHPQYLQHDTKSHPENSGRLKAIQEKIKQSKIYPHLYFPEPRRAIDDELTRIIILIILTMSVTVAGMANKTWMETPLFAQNLGTLLF